MFLSTLLPDRLCGYPPNTIVAVYYSSIDAQQKDKIQADFVAGRTRILICTDAFGLGVNIKDIKVVIQWGIDEKCNINHLSQRLGRAVRNPHLEGIGIVYVAKSIFATSKDSGELNWERAWNDPNLLVEPGTDDEDEEGNPRAIPVSKERQLVRFGIPVRQDTKDKIKVHVRQLYREAKSLKEAHLEALRERRGKVTNKVNMAKKIDPAVLWFVCTEGCRHSIFGSLYNDPKLWDRSHRHWCCDNCVVKEGSDLSKITTAGFSAARSISNPAKITLENAIFVRPQPRVPTWDCVITPERTERVRLRLTLARDYIWQELNLLDTMPAVVLSDKALSEVVKHVNRITSVEYLKLELEKAGLLIQSSLLSEEYLGILFFAIEGAVKEVIKATVTGT